MSNHCHLTDEQLDTISRKMLQQTVEFTQEALDETFDTAGLPRILQIEIDEKDAHQYYDAFRVCMLEAIQANEKAKWQPIETAPKDGRLILTYAPEAHKYSGIPSVRVNYFYGCAWQKTNHKLYPPTHWMPLPNPPESETAHD
jgi:hypothetical protein